MLDKVIYLGHELSEFSFSSKISNKGEGYFDAKITSSVEDVIVRDDLNKEEDGEVFSYPSHVSVIGYESDGDDKLEVFSLSFNIETLFKFSEPSIDYKKLVKENLWFFDNFATIDISSTAEDLLKNTPYRGVKLAKRRD